MEMAYHQVALYMITDFRFVIADQYTKFLRSQQSEKNIICKDVLSFWKLWDLINTSSLGTILLVH